MYPSTFFNTEMSHSFRYFIPQEYRNKDKQSKEAYLRMHFHFQGFYIPADYFPHSN